jgi:cytochrome c peroxidase
MAHKLAAAAALGVVVADPLPPDATYRPLPTLPFSAVKLNDEARKTDVMMRQRTLLERRYDLSDRSLAGVRMSGGRKSVQGGVRVKLPAGVTWDGLAAMSPEEIRRRDLLPEGFKPLPHVKQATGGQMFPRLQIDAIDMFEQRDLRRFDVDFDLPDHLTPEFPPPIFLTTRPELGDVSRGQLLSLRNFYEIMNGIVTPVQWRRCRTSSTSRRRPSSIRSAGSIRPSPRSRNSQESGCSTARRDAPNATCRRRRSSTTRCTT